MGRKAWLYYEILLLIINISYHDLLRTTLFYQILKNIKNSSEQLGGPQSDICLP